MKTLDEVIKAYEICLNEECCDDCPYTEHDAEGRWACSLCGDCPRDALHYLREYRDTRAQLLDGMKRLEGYELMFIKAMADLEDNPPLTWDELRQMEGKPVWVEVLKESGDHYKWEGQWMIIDDFMQGALGTYCQFKEWHKTLINTTYGDQWQAYRKERE